MIIETLNSNPNYDELLSDIDLSPMCKFTDELDVQIDQLIDKLRTLGYDNDFIVKVTTEAMRRYHEAQCKFFEMSRKD